MGSKQRTLHDLVLHQVKDLYYAERHLSKILLKMAKAAMSEALRVALEQRHEATAIHVDRLEACFELLDKKPHGVPCEAMDGIIAETKSLIDEFEESEAIDAGLIGAVEAMEHYAVARYVVLIRWARQANLASVADQCGSTLSEARQALDRWSTLAGSLPASDLTHAGPAFTLKDAALMGLK